MIDVLLTRSTIAEARDATKLRLGQSAFAGI
jgi:hypothetical protein